jgi:hypothetical protein
MTETNRERFDKAVTIYIKREGIDKLVNWLEKDTDFFTAPSSVNNHGNFEGGLLEHSLNVSNFAFVNFNFMLKYRPELENLKESVIISALFHDVCKTNIYKKAEKWTKDSNNKWKSYQGYEVKDDLPLSHGHKSVYLINKHMQLTDEEALAVAHHMGSFMAGNVIPGMDQMTYNAAFEHPLVVIIHAADILATKVEKTIDYKNL